MRLEFNGGAWIVMDVIRWVAGVSLPAQLELGARVLELESTCDGVFNMVEEFIED